MSSRNIQRISEYALTPAWGPCAAFHPWHRRYMPASPVHVSPESTRPYTSRPSFAGRCKLAADVYRAGHTSKPSLQGPCKLAADVYRAGTHGRVPVMVRILMAHVGREFAGSRAFRPHVYRRGVPPVHMRGEFAGRPRTGGRRVPPRRLPAPVCPEFRATVQTRRRCVPAPIASVLVRPEFTDPLQTRGRIVPHAQSS